MVLPPNWSEVISVDRNGATTTINDNADFIVVERDLFLIRDHRRFLGLELTHICRKLFLLALDWVIGFLHWSCWRRSAEMPF